MERGFADQIAAAAPEAEASARNLLHYLALRQQDLRDLQPQLSWLGLSSLGRLEAHTLAGLDAVLAALHKLANRDMARPDDAGRRGPAAHGDPAVTATASAISAPC